MATGNRSAEAFSTPIAGTAVNQSDNLLRATPKRLITALRENDFNGTIKTEQMRVPNKKN